MSLRFQQEEIDQLIFEIGCIKVTDAEQDIVLELGIDGDDFEDLLVAFRDIFFVDMGSYLWYFHSNGEGGNGLGIIRSPRELVNHIPVTPKMLLDFANAGKWDVKYPEHEIKRVWFFQDPGPKI